MQTSDTLSEAEFLPLAKAVIGRVRQAIDAEDPDVVECVPDADVVKIAFPSGPPFVLNQQRPVKEMWLAADRQAWHFRFDGVAWVDKRSGDELFAVLVREVARRCGRTLRF
jgi:CyaY protein